MTKAMMQKIMESIAEELPTLNALDELVIVRVENGYKLFKDTRNV